MPHPYTKKRNATVLAAVTSMSKICVLLFVGFGFGAMVTLSNTMFDDIQQQDESGRKLFVAADTPPVSGPAQAAPHKMIRSSPATSIMSNQQPVRDGGTNGRVIHRNELESINERLQLVETHRQSLKSNNPPTPVSFSFLASRNNNTRVGTQKDIDFCRKQVFVTQYKNEVQAVPLDKSCNSPEAKRFNVCHDLADFTGLSMEEVLVRMARLDQYHFEEEHLFWNPQTTTELAWYYSTSQSYLFANAIHPPMAGILDRLQKDIHEPVLDFSGGVGNTVLYLALDRGLKSHYFGIGMVEKAFARFRVAKRGLQDKITFRDPWSEASSWKFDPIKALPRDGSLGSILAVDVLEHIPNYQHTVAAMVDSLKVGGVIVERTPFATFPVRGGNNDNEKVDTRIHVHDGGITMEQAMGDRMVYRQEAGYWEKIKDA